MDTASRHDRLIEAAPELLEALRQIVEQCDDRPRGCTKNSPVIAKARAVLAKLDAADRVAHLEGLIRIYKNQAGHSGYDYLAVLLLIAFLSAIGGVLYYLIFKPLMKLWS